MSQPKRPVQGVKESHVDVRHERGRGGGQDLHKQYSDRGFPDTRLPFVKGDFCDRS